MFEATLAGIPGCDRGNRNPVYPDRVDMMKNTGDELLDLVWLGRYDTGEVGRLRRRVEHIYPSGYHGADALAVLSRRGA